MRRAVLPSLILIAAGLTWSATSRAESKPTPELAPPNAPKSEFSFRPGFTKDPFYPRSTEVVVTPTVVNPRTSVQPTVPDFVVLKGISTANGRRLAIINFQTVSEGEDVNLKSGAKTVTVRCVQIKDESVVVSVDGATKEITLRRR